MSKPHKPNRRREKRDRRHQPSRPAISRKPPVLSAPKPIVDRVEIDMDLRWFVVRTYPQHEAVVGARLKGMGHAVYLPRQEVKKVRRGRLYTATRYMLPRHMFLGLAPGPGCDPWRAITDERGIIQGAYDIFRFYGRDVVIDPESLQEFADTISGEMEEWVAPTAAIKNGQLVKIIDGPFLAFNAVVTGPAPGGMVQAEVQIFGRKTPVDLRLDQLEAAE